MNNVKVEITNDMVQSAIDSYLKDMISRSMETHKIGISKQVGDYFSDVFIGRKLETLERGLDWALEDCFRTGVNKAMTELNYTEMIAEKAKELLVDDKFIRDLAQAKVMDALGLKND